MKKKRMNFVHLQKRKSFGKFATKGKIWNQRQQIYFNKQKNWNKNKTTVDELE